MLALVLALSAGLPAATPAQKPWQNVGYALPSGGWSPTLTVAGVPTGGLSCSVSIHNAAPGVVGSLFLGVEQYASVGGGTFVPAPQRRINFTTDSNGAYSGSFVWTLSNPGAVIAIQATVRDGQGNECFTNAVLGTTLTAAEAFAYSTAIAACSNWDGISVASVSELISIQSSNDITATADMMLNYGHLPNTTLGSTAFAVGTISQFSIDTQLISDYHGVLQSQMSVGDTTVEVQWKSVGVFTSYSIVNVPSAHTRYDTFIAMMPPSWPFLAPSSAASDHQLCDPSPCGGSTGVQTALGTTIATVSSRATGQCDANGKASGCGAELLETCVSMYDVAIGKQCAPSADGASCCCTVNYGVVSGFKSIDALPDGSLHVSGSLGSEVQWSVVICKACPE